MSREVIDKLLKLGCKTWHRNGLHRIYLPRKVWTKYAGLNIEEKRINGLKAPDFRIMRWINAADKVWYEEGNFHCKGIWFGGIKEVQREIIYNLQRSFGL